MGEGLGAAFRVLGAREVMGSGGRGAVGTAFSSLRSCPPGPSWPHVAGVSRFPIGVVPKSIAYLKSDFGPTKEHQ